MKRTYKSIKGAGDATNALDTGVHNLDPNDFSGAADLAALKRLQMVEKQAAQSNSVYDSAQKGLLIREEM